MLISALILFVIYVGRKWKCLRFVWEEYAKKRRQSLGQAVLTGTRNFLAWYGDFEVFVVPNICSVRINSQYAQLCWAQSLTSLATKVGLLLQKRYLGIGQPLHNFKCDYLMAACVLSCELHCLTHNRNIMSDVNVAHSRTSSFEVTADRRKQCAERDVTAFPLLSSTSRFECPDHCTFTITTTNCIKRQPEAKLIL